jgi:RNA polymerase sigma-70 factor (ECF subfamily)
VLAAELSSRFRDRLRFFAARRLRDRDAAEDVAQEVLRRTLEALRAGRVENLAALPAFLFQTARHICMHHGRSAQRQAHAMERSVDPGDPAERPDTYDPVAALIDEERRSMVRKAMAVLGDADREILRLSFMDGLDAEAIGIRLGITPGAVRVRRHRAVTRLAEKLPVTERPERGR